MGPENWEVSFQHSREIHLRYCRLREALLGWWFQWVLVTSQGNSSLTCGTVGAACATARTVGPRDKAMQSQGDHEGLWPFCSDSESRAIGLPVWGQEPYLVIHTAWLWERFVWKDANVHQVVGGHCQESWTEKESNDRWLLVGNYRWPSISLQYVPRLGGGGARL